MLVASTAMSLITPLAAQASDTVNLDKVNNFSEVQRFDDKTFTNEVSDDLTVLKDILNRLSDKGLIGSDDLANLKESLDETETKQNVLEAGGFSDTTTMDGKAIFTLGSVEYDDNSGNEAIQAYYSYTMNLNSSFTGDDNLYVRIKSGNGGDFANSKTYGTYLSSNKANGDVLKVDKIWYQFPVGENNTVWVGPKIENYYMHGTSPSIYKPVTKQFTLGGNGNAYGASTDTGAGWAYQADNGFAISSNIGTKSTTTGSVDILNDDDVVIGSKAVNTGLLTDQTKTSWATQIGYTQPRYSGSVIVNRKTNGWSDSYYKAGDINGDASSTDPYTAIGLRGWWRPESTGSAAPSVSVGYDTTEYDSSAGQEKADAWFVGLNWQDIFRAEDRIGAAFGKPTTNESSDLDPFAYEVYYSFKPNDSVTITPTIFGGSNRNGTADGDITGALIETTFKF